MFVGDVYESEPSDAETIDSESSEDEWCDDSETERITEPEEEVVCKKENLSSECASADEVTNSPINRLSCTSERSQNISPLPDDQDFRQQVAKGAAGRQSAVEVLESYAVSAQLASIGSSCKPLEGAGHQTLTATSSCVSSATALVSATTGACLRGSSEKPTAVSLAAEFGSSTVSKPQSQCCMQRSVAPINDARFRRLATSSAEKCRRIVPASCASIGTSASVAQASAVKVEPESGEQLMNGTESHEQLTSGTESNERLINGNSNAQLMSGTESSEQLMNGTESHEQLMSGTESSEQLMNGKSNEQLMNGTFTITHEDDDVSELKKISRLSSVVKGHNSTYSIPAAGPSMSETFNITDVSKHYRSVDLEPSLGKSVVIADLGTSNKTQSYGAVAPTHHRSVDLDPSLGKSVVIADLGSLTTNEKQLFGAVAPTRQTCMKPRSRDLFRLLPSTNRVEIVCSQRKPVAAVLPQAVATKKLGSALLQGPVLSTVCDRLADVCDQSAVNSCWIATCCSHPVYGATSKPVSSKVSPLTKMVNSAHLSDCCTSVPRSVTATVELNPLPLMQEVPCSMKMVKSTPVTSNHLKISGYKDHQTSLNHGFSCKVSNNNAGESEYISDTGILSMGTDISSVLQKSSQRRVRGFATSTPLRDSSPPPDISFCSLSSISLVSDWEDYDAAETSDDDVEPEDDVILLDVAFVSDSLPSSTQSVASPSPINSKPQCLSHKAGVDSRPKAFRRLSRPANTKNVGTSDSRSNSRDCVTTKSYKLSTGVGSVRNKRTRHEVSSSDSEDGSSTKNSLHTPRKSRALFSETRDISCCLGPAQCTKAICFRCHCN